MQDENIRKIITEAVDAIPSGTKVYLVGGAARNAMYYRMFRKKLPQRDFDLIVMGDFHHFIHNLRSNGFVYGKIRRKHQIVVKKKKVKKPKHRDKDYVVLDIKNSAEKNMLHSIKKEANFTINGFAIPLNSLNNADWSKKVIKLPIALKDLKNRRLRVNALFSHSYNLFAAIRFISIGFKAPTKKEIKLLIKALIDFDHKKNQRRYKRNLEKLYGYVGGKKKAERILRELGLSKEVLKFIL